MSQSLQCTECAHYYGLFRCDAFPDRDIPQEILSGKHDRVSRILATTGSSAPCRERLAPRLSYQV